MTRPLFAFFFTRRLLAGVLCAALCSLTCSAHAQSDKAAAEALFREAMRLSKAHDYAEACPKFEESQRLEPSLGAQYYLADCYEQIGRTASAWANFSEVADKERLASDAAKEKAARQRADALEPKLSHLTVDVTDRGLSGLTVRRGDLAIGYGQWGVAVPVDPGSYVLEASAPGRKSWSKTIDVPSGASLSERVPELEALPAAAASPEPFVAPATSPVEPPRAQPPSHAQRTAGVVVAGAGVLALGTGGVLALLAKGALSDSKRAGECTTDNSCSKAGLSDRNRALSLADAATVVSIVGAAAVITGGVLWFSAPRSRSESSPGASAELGVGLNSLLLRGEF